MIAETLEEELHYLRKKNLYRSLRVMEPLRGIRASYQKKEIRLFCGNDYLGLARHPRVIEAGKRAADTHGVGAGAARLISGTHDVHSQLEEKIAAFKGKPRALVYSTGYLANVGCLSALCDKNDMIVMDKLCHASLIDGARLSGAALRVFPHRNYERCEEILKRSHGHRRRVVVTETVFSMDGDLADLPALVRLKEKYDALLMIDDAHGTGVLGKTGRGGCEDDGLEDRVDVITGTLSKAIGTLGGFVAASGQTVDFLINRSRPFLFATALSPVLCAAALEAIRVIEESPGLHQTLWDNVAKMKSVLKGQGYELGMSRSPILPIMIGEERDAVSASEQLLDQGLFIPAIRPPSVPKGKARLRATVSALHTQDDLNHFEKGIGLLGKALKKNSV